MREIIIGVFRRSMAAQQAIEELCDAGFLAAQIGFLAHEEEPDAPGSQPGLASAITRMTPHGMPGIMGVVGMEADDSATAADPVSELSWALDVARGTLPGGGAVVAGGLFASVLEGGDDAVARRLADLGVTEVEAAHYQEELCKGRSIIVVQGRLRARTVLSILGRNGSFERSLFRVVDDKPAPLGACSA